jgi:hypothetical protein
MKVCHSQITPRLDHFKAEERGAMVSIMAVGHLVSIKVQDKNGKGFDRMISFNDLNRLLFTIPEQPDRGYNRIP